MGRVGIVPSRGPAPGSSITPHWEGWWLTASGVHRLECSGLYFCRMAGGEKHLLRLPMPQSSLKHPVSLSTSRVHHWDCSFYPVKWTGDSRRVQWATGVCCFLGCLTPCHPTGPLGWGTASSWVEPRLCWVGGSGAETCPGTPGYHDPGKTLLSSS